MGPEQRGASMYSIFGDIAYTFIASLIVGPYLGGWIVRYGDDPVTIRQIIWIVASVMIAVGIGPLTYAVSNFPPADPFSYSLRLYVAGIGNSFVCPVSSLLFGALFRLLGMRNVPPT